MTTILFAGTLIIITLLFLANEANKDQREELHKLVLVVIASVMIVFIFGLMTPTPKKLVETVPTTEAVFPEKPLNPTANRYRVTLKLQDGQVIDLGYQNTDDFYRNARLEIDNQNDVFDYHHASLEKQVEEIKSKNGLIFTLYYQDVQEWKKDHWYQPNGSKPTP